VDAEVVGLYAGVIPPGDVAGVDQGERRAGEGESGGGVERVEAVDGNDGSAKHGEDGGVGMRVCLGGCEWPGHDGEVCVTREEGSDVAISRAEGEGDGEVGLGLSVEVDDER